MTEGEPKPWSNEWVRERETVQVLDIPDLGPAPDRSVPIWLLAIIMLGIAFGVPMKGRTVGSLATVFRKVASIVRRIMRAHPAAASSGLAPAHPPLANIAGGRWRIPSSVPTSTSRPRSPHSRRGAAFRPWAPCLSVASQSRVFTDANGLGG